MDSPVAAQKGLELITKPLLSAPAGVYVCVRLHLSCPGGAQLGYGSFRLCCGSWVHGSSVHPRPPPAPPRPQPGPVSPGQPCKLELTGGQTGIRCHPHPPPQQSETDGSQRGLVAWTLPLSQRDPVSSPGPTLAPPGVGSKTKVSQPLPRTFVITDPPNLNTQRGFRIESKPLGRKTETQRG